ncbi:MAG: hypothetical protein ABI479_06690 [Gallionella sp.]
MESKKPTCVGFFYGVRSVNYFFIASTAAGAAASVAAGAEAAAGAATRAAAEDTAAFSPQADRAKANSATTRAECFISGFP